MVKHNSIKRITHRLIEEISASFDIAKAISIKAAFITFIAKIDIQIMNRNGFKEPPRVMQRLIQKHETMLNYLDKKYGDFWTRYKFEDKLPDTNKQLRNKVWVCWWQGLENAPEIVKCCVDSIKRHTLNTEIIIITEKNYQNYVSFPIWIEEKASKGFFSKTHFSDLLRMNILATYGGIWIDSTFFCTDHCLDKYIKFPIWSIKRPDYLHASVASGFFAGYSLGCSYENRWVFKVIRDFLFYYWKYTDKLIDYLLVDYAIVLSQRHNKVINDLFKEILPNNSNCDELCKILGKEYDEHLWKNIQKDTNLYKLTWKVDFPKTVNGKETFYGKLINNTLV